jgi:predicted nucleic acid-binding Zn ribbon protein
MLRAARVLRTLATAQDPAALEAWICAAWRGVVGARIARHARAERLVRNRLVVGVDDAVWQRQLFAMRGQIVHKLRQQTGADFVDAIEFRVSPPRREPQRAARSDPRQTSLFDEAAGIADPVLRRLYLASRKRETA